MASRKARRGANERTAKIQPKAKKQLIFMLISIALMVFSVTQVYYLARYTLGHDVSQEKLKVYRWVYMLLEDNTTTK